MAGPEFLNTLSPSPFWCRYIINYASFLIGNIVSKITITGKWNLPKEGPYVISCNHFSYFDPLFSTYGVQKPLNFIAASDQTIKWYFMWAPIIYGWIPIDRRSIAPSSIKKALNVLKRGEILFIYPEGMQTSNALQKPKNGAVFLSTVGKAPIVPMSIHGAENLWENIFLGVRSRIKINIGKPFGPIEFGGTKTEKEKILKETGRELMCRIAALLPEKSHGVFKGDKKIKYYKKENGDINLI